MAQALSEGCPLMGAWKHVSMGETELEETLAMIGILSHFDNALLVKSCWT